MIGFIYAFLIAGPETGCIAISNEAMQTHSSAHPGFSETAPLPDLVSTALASLASSRRSGP